MPKKSFFRTTGNKSTKSLPESTTLTIGQEQCSTPTPTMTSWTEAALEKANMAVLYDFTGAPKQALDAYNEAIVLLDKVFESTNDCVSQTRLKKIYDSYISRVSILTQQLDNNELDPAPSISIPVAQLPHESLHSDTSSTPIPTPTKKSATKSQRRPPLSKLTDSHLQSQLDPATASLPPTSCKSPKSLPAKSPTGSLFGSMFLKKQPSKPNLKTPTPSHSVFSMPSPSKSTPTLSANQSTMFWKKQTSMKKNRYSTVVDPLDTESFSFSCKIELPSLALPGVEIQKDDDYFDLQSTMATKNLLYSNPEPMLASMQDLHQKDTKEMGKANDRIGNKLYGSAGNFHENDSTAAKQDDDNAPMTREQSFSSSSSSSSNTTTTIKHQPPQLTSSASSTLTFNSSICSPTSSTWTNLDEDNLSNKSPLPPSLLLPDITSDSTTTSFFGLANEHDIGTLTKFLAESAATMPGRSHRTSNSTMVPSIAAVIEEAEAELSLSVHRHHLPHDTHQQRSLLSRSTSTKSISSVKSRGSSHSDSKPNKKGTPNDDLSTTPPTPSSSAKTITFWSKRRSTSTKQKSLPALPPLQLDHNTDDSVSWMVLSPPIISQPPTPKSMTSSIDHTMASPRTSSSSSSSKRPIIHPLQHPSHSFGTYATQTATNKGIDVSMTMTSITMNKNNKQPKLMARLQQSMEQGGYITDRLHVPKQLWCQKQVRLPAMDAKITACEQLVTVLERMHAITRLLDQLDLPQKDITSEAFHTLGRLESILDTIRQTFGKQGHEHSSVPPLPAAGPQGKHLTTTTTPTIASSTISSLKDPMTAWSGKLSKSVERMKIDTKSSTEQIHVYRSTLIRLFTLTSIFDRWRDIFTKLLENVSMNKVYLYDHLLQKTMMCNGTFHTVICSFVMQDLYLLMDKWLKRNRDWFLD